MCKLFEPGYVFHCGLVCPAVVKKLDDKHKVEEIEIEHGALYSLKARLYNVDFIKDKQLFLENSSIKSGWVIHPKKEKQYVVFFKDLITLKFAMEHLLNEIRLNNEEEAALFIRNIDKHLKKTNEC